jgi:hypothetical protein
VIESEGCSAAHLVEGWATQPAPVAQWIEQRFPKRISSQSETPITTRVSARLLGDIQGIRERATARGGTGRTLTARALG